MGKAQDIEPGAGAGVACESGELRTCPFDSPAANDGACLGADDCASEDGSLIEVVDRFDDFEAVGDLPFVVEPANAARIGEGSGRADNDFTSIWNFIGIGDESAPTAPADLENEAPADPFSILAEVMTNAMTARGPAPHDVHLLRALVGLERMGDRSPREAACSALVSAKLATMSGRGLVRTPQFEREVLAWQRILRGESDDLAACGAAPLDEWAATIVASTLGEPSQAASIRRELRAHGVAAFGLVADAAA